MMHGKNAASDASVIRRPAATIAAHCKYVPKRDRSQGNLPDMNHVPQTYGELAESGRLYWTLRSLLPQRGPAAVLVTSASRGEGKTVVAAGLAMAASRLHDGKVLAADMNWYAPALHTCFGLERGWSLTDVALASLTPPVQSSDHGPDVLVAPLDGAQGAGEADPVVSALALAEWMKRDYGLCVLDATAVFPPNRRMTDPVTLARAVDAVVLVVQAGRTSGGLAKRARQTLAAASTCLVGLVVNHKGDGLWP